MATPPVFSAGAVLTAAQMNAVGLWKITGLTATVTGAGATVSVDNGTATISGNASTITLSNAFPSDFNAFQIVFTNLDANTPTAALVIQLVESNGTVSTTNYSSTGIYMTFPSTTVNGINLTQWDMGLSSTNAANSFYVYNVNLAVDSYFQASTVDDTYFRTYGGKHTTATAYTGLKMFPNAGTITGGKISIYGYRQ